MIQFLCSLLPDWSGYKLFRGIFCFPWPEVLLGAVKVDEVRTQGRMVCERHQTVGKGVKGKSRPRGSDPACWRYNKGH